MKSLDIIEAYSDEILHQVEQIQRNDNLVLQGLVLLDGGSVTFALVLFSTEVLDGLVVEETISMNTTSGDVTLVHLPTNLCTPAGENNARVNCGKYKLKKIL